MTNGLGGFARGTVGDAHTRTYHDWLMAAIDPPSQRTLSQPGRTGESVSTKVLESGGHYEGGI